MMNLEFPVAYLFFPHLPFPGPRYRGGTPAHMALCTPGTPPGLNLCYCGRQGQAYPSRHTRRGAASLPRLMLDAGAGNEHVWHWRTKSFTSLSFLLVLHISLSSIYITLHIFQVHTKCILCEIINYLIWFEDGYRILQLLMRLTSPMSLIE